MAYRDPLANISYLFKSRCFLKSDTSYKSREKSESEWSRETYYEELEEEAQERDLKPRRCCTQKRPSIRRLATSSTCHRVPAYKTSYRGDRLYGDTILSAGWDTVRK